MENLSIYGTHPVVRKAENLDEEAFAHTDNVLQEPLYSPDNVVLFGVPDSESKYHWEQVEEIASEIDSAGTVILNEDLKERAEVALKNLDYEEIRTFSYDSDEKPSRWADMRKIMDEFQIGSEDSFLGIAQDYSIPRNIKLFDRFNEKSNAPKDGYIVQIPEIQGFGKDLIWNSVGHRLPSNWSYFMPDDAGAPLTNMKTSKMMSQEEIKLNSISPTAQQTNHLIIGTSLETIEDYNGKFFPTSLSTEAKDSEMIRRSLPQFYKDVLKEIKDVEY